MMIIDGKKIADEIQIDLALRVAKEATRPPALAVILVGSHVASMVYVDRKTKACASVGIRSIKISLADSISEKELLKHIELLNEDPAIDGILVQMPLPKHINPLKITHAISPQKDVDGFHPYNVGKMLLGETDGFIPCTPLGIKTLLEKYHIETCGKHAVIIGRSNIVGKPMAALLMQSTKWGNATVTVAHSQSKDLSSLTLSADILIVAMGQPQFITASMVKEGACVIDVGINRIEDAQMKNGYRIVGDVDFANVAPKCSAITPVPGGIGPMTIAMLLENTFHSYTQRAIS